jgi:hypothetical protein
MSPQELPDVYLAALHGGVENLSKLSPIAVQNISNSSLIEGAHRASVIVKRRLGVELRRTARTAAAFVSAASAHGCGYAIVVLCGVHKSASGRLWALQFAATDATGIDRVEHWQDSRLRHSRRLNDVLAMRDGHMDRVACARAWPLDEAARLRSSKQGSDLVRDHRDSVRNNRRLMRDERPSVH